MSSIFQKIRLFVGLKVCRYFLAIFKCLPLIARLNIKSVRRMCFVCNETSSEGIHDEVSEARIGKCNNSKASISTVSIN